MHTDRTCTRQDLIHLACEAMSERGLAPDFPPAVELELATLSGAPHDLDATVADLRTLPWRSIDNDDSLDLDQLTACESLASGAVCVRVAIADVDALVLRGSAIDAQACLNTTSVYTSVRVFPMLPERLSTDLTSLNVGQDRLALVTEMVVDAEGVLTSSPP
ncbi:RNB domain-containing ribonuclease [uncultured Sphaerotilus sp.]|uniref:RNB domain-containing ribonuclease n=1 Tax=uncultured Sphaerotilus sp. TaxID=474984 RepID=UPI0030CA5748